MNRRLAIAVVLAGIAANTGCLNIQPVGPMARALGTPEKPTPAIKGAVSTPDPITVPSPKPVPPAMLVTPGEVSELNPTDATKRQMEELEQDRRSMEAMPKTSEVSVIKGKR
jgi:hypothetical protein